MHVRRTENPKCMRNETTRHRLVQSPFHHVSEEQRLAASQVTFLNWKHLTCVFTIFYNIWKFLFNFDLSVCCLFQDLNQPTEMQSTQDFYLWILNLRTTDGLIAFFFLPSNFILLSFVWVKRNTISKAIHFIKPSCKECQLKILWFSCRGITEDNCH